MVTGMVKSLLCIWQNLNTIFVKKRKKKNSYLDGRVTKMHQDISTRNSVSDD
jgi:hypothetical protein